MRRTKTLGKKSRLWKPTPFVCKINVALFLQEDKAAYDDVLFTYQGEFVTIVNGFLHYPQDPFMAETLACREALLWLKEHGITRARLVSNCIGVINDLVKNQHIRSYLVVFLINTLLNVLC